MRVLEKGTMAYASEIEIGSGVLWLPYKNIHDSVLRAANADYSDDAFAELENCSRNYKTDFVAFLSAKVREIGWKLRS
jgi:hypothetical protein